MFSAPLPFKQAHDEHAAFSLGRIGARGDCRVGLPSAWATRAESLGRPKLSPRTCNSRKTPLTEMQALSLNPSYEAPVAETVSHLENPL